MEKNSLSNINLDKPNNKTSSAEEYNTSSMRQLNDAYDPMINKDYVKGSWSHQDKKK